MIASVNGKLMDASRATVSIMDRGFLYGDGLFETVMARNRKLLFWDRHVARLEAAASALGFILPAAAALRQGLEDVVAANEGDRMLVRLTVTRGTSAGGVFVDDDMRPTVVVTARPAAPSGPELFDKGWRITVAGTLRASPFPGRGAIKTTSYLSSILSMEYARLVGADEAVMLDEAGRLTEGSRTNLFAVIGGRLVTPALACGVLPGVTRALVMDIAEAACGGCEEVKMKPRELARADEAFMTGTAWGIVPVSHFDGDGISGGKPGTLTKILHKAYEALVDRAAEEGT